MVVVSGIGSFLVVIIIHVHIGVAPKGIHIEHTKLQDNAVIELGNSECMFTGQILVGVVTKFHVVSFLSMLSVYPHIYHMSRV
jgi:hypothetical protein